jgi:histidine triad (HIT) family protein
MTDTIFGQIARGEMEADVVYEDERCVAFRDIAPQAPVHVLVIPRESVTSLREAKEMDAGLLGHLLQVCASVAESEGLGVDGYRVVVNTGSNGGQTVEHLHLHVLGGRAMAWPPG